MPSYFRSLPRFVLPDPGKAIDMVWQIFVQSSKGAFKMGGEVGLDDDVQMSITALQDSMDAANIVLQMPHFGSRFVHAVLTDAACIDPAAWKIPPSTNQSTNSVPAKMRLMAWQDGLLVLCAGLFYGLDSGTVVTDSQRRTVFNELLRTHLRAQWAGLVPAVALREIEPNKWRPPLDVERLGRAFQDAGGLSWASGWGDRKEKAKTSIPPSLKVWITELRTSADIYRLGSVEGID